jgi:hypothetical protein
LRGITLIVEGILKQFLEVIKDKDPRYETNLRVIQDALMKGLEIIKKEVDE